MEMYMSLQTFFFCRLSLHFSEMKYKHKHMRNTHDFSMSFSTKNDDFFHILIRLAFVISHKTNKGKRMSTIHHTCSYFTFEFLKTSVTNLYMKYEKVINNKKVWTGMVYSFSLSLLNLRHGACGMFMHST